ncbi:MAG: undecaprenyl-diphosphatase UppP [Bacteroidota bacterium]
MSLLEAIILGLIQGITEFLPISSTAHLRVIPALVGWNDPGAAVSAVIQLGTLIAVLVYFRRDILRLIRAFITGLVVRKPFESVDSRMAWWVGLGTIPVVLAGLILKNAIETSFRSLYVIAASLFLLALILIVAEKTSSFRRQMEEMKWWEAFIVGIAQAFALIPGSSRSGTTITASLFLGITREAAARFSFLLSIPAVTASGLYELYEIRHELTGSLGIELIIATLVAAVSGYLAIEFLLRYLRTHTTFVFVWYRIALAILILIVLQFGIVMH